MRKSFRMLLWWSIKRHLVTTFILCSFLTTALLYLFHKSENVTHKALNKYENTPTAFLKSDGGLVCTSHFPMVDGFTKEDNCPMTMVQPLCIRNLRHLPDSRANGPDVTLTTHLSVHRLENLQRICNHWTGPISAALFVNNASLMQSSDLFKSDLHHLLGKNQQLSIQLVISYNQTLYPTNALRQIASNHSSTSHFLLMDADFIPAPQSYNRIGHWLKQKNELAGDKARVYVVPAFKSLNGSLEMPKTKLDLIHPWSLGRIQIFGYHKKYHGPTDFEKFILEDSPYKIEFERGFEPYLVVPKGSPPPDARFVGYHKNKIAYTKMLDAHGYQFYVLPDVYIIHYPHAESKDHKTLREYRRCNDKLWLQYKEELEIIKRIIEGDQKGK